MLKGIFPIPFYEANNLDVTGVAASVEKQEFHRNTENNGFLSVDENLLDNPIFANLRLQVDSHVHAYKEQMKIQDTCDFYIKSSWAVVHQKGDFAQQHFHRHSVLSGVLYVLVDEKAETSFLQIGAEGFSQMRYHQNLMNILHITQRFIRYFRRLGTYSFSHHTFPILLRNVILMQRDLALPLMSS